MKKYNIQQNNRKLVASILSASVLFGMLAGCSDIDKYIRTNNGNSTGASTYTTESIINSSLNTYIDSTSSSIETNGITQNEDSSNVSSVETILTTETTEPYSDINWSIDSESGFYTYLLYNYNIKLDVYIDNFGLDDYLNQYFTEYINQTRGTNYEYVPWEVTKTYFRYTLQEYFPSAIFNGNRDLIPDIFYSKMVINFEMSSLNPYYNYDFFKILYKNDILFGNKIPKNIYEIYFDNTEGMLTTSDGSNIRYNRAFNVFYWYYGEFVPDVQLMDQENINLINDFLSGQYEQYGYEVHPTVGEPITKELLLAMFPDRAEEIEELAAQKEAEQANEESQVETAETTRGH